jgi:hypothetical protein
MAQGRERSSRLPSTDGAESSQPGEGAPASLNYRSATVLISQGRRSRWISSPWRIRTA